MTVVRQHEAVAARARRREVDGIPLTEVITVAVDDVAPVDLCRQSNNTTGQTSPERFVPVLHKNRSAAFYVLIHKRIIISLKLLLSSD